MVLCPAVPADEDRLLGWRNLPESIAFSTLKKTVNPNDHHEWFGRVLSNPDQTQIFIAKNGDTAIGTVRFDRKDTETARISAYLLPAYYGSGLGHRVIALSLSEIALKWPDLRTVDALVLNNNPRGAKAFCKGGFVRMPLCDEPDHVRYSVTFASGHHRQTGRPES